MSLAISSSKRPIFVVGAPRSGTTLLRYMLCAHPHIYIPPESNFILRFLSHEPHTPLTHAQAVELITAVCQYKVFFRDWQEEMLEAETFVKAFSDENRTPANLLKTLYQQYARQYGARRWGDKSPIYAGHVAQLAKLFPNAQFVHIIRDGRDVSLSMLKAYQGIRFFYMDLGFAAQSWKRRVQKARRAGAALGAKHYFELHYEQLTTEPRKVLRSVCGFLGEPFVPEMVTPHHEASRHFHSRGIHGAARQPLTTKSSGRWRPEMRLSDQRLFQAMVGGLLADLGYETVALGKLSISERVRLAALASKYTAVEAGRHMLQVAGVAHPAALMATMTKNKGAFRFRK